MPETEGQPESTCYVSGAISGLPEEVFRLNFAVACELLRGHGIAPVNPLEVQPECDDSCNSKETFDDGSYKHTWQCYMRYDLIALLKCDMIFAQANAMQSPGAQLEIGIAQKLGMPLLSSDGKGGIEGAW